MTRTYAAKRLLEHGPLTLRDFRAITGWTDEQCRKTIDMLQEQVLIKRDTKKGTYRLAERALP